MSQSFCSASEHVIEKGYRAVTLENELLSITLLPERGAEVYREPFTSIPGRGLQNAIAAGTAPSLPPGGKIEANILAMFIEGQEHIESIDLNGNVVQIAT